MVQTDAAYLSGRFPNSRGGFALDLLRLDQSVMVRSTVGKMGWGHVKGQDHWILIVVESREQTGAPAFDA
jgi:hypothetical protein